MERTLNETKLSELLKYSESSCCDFKERIYSLEDNHSKTSFLKDILAMANTVRTGSAYIIIGVRQRDGHNEFNEVDPNIDENNFITYIKGNVSPEFPEVTYYTMKYQKHIIGVFEIGISSFGPFVSKKDHGEKIKANQVYYRLGSVNSDASSEEIARITQWMKNYENDNFKLIAKELELNEKNYNYILFIGDKCKLSNNHYEMLLGVQWALIIDLTKNSENGGFFSAFNQEREKLFRHQITTHLKELPPFTEGKTLFWYLAPLLNKPGDEDKKDIKEWISENFTAVNSCINEVMSSLSKEVIFVSLFIGEFNEACANTMILSQLKNSIFYKYVNFFNDKNFSINNNRDIVEIGSLYDDICKAFTYSRSSTIDKNDYCLISEHCFTVSDPQWIHEEMQPLYINIENNNENNTILDLSYFQGREIQWNELNPCIAVTRKKYKDLVYKVEQTFNIKNTRAELITINYEAGSGVTTIMRMLAWHFHEEHPVVILNRYSKDGTRERLRSLLSDVKRNRILLIVDIHDLDSQLMYELVRNLEVDNVPITILFSKRYLKGGVENYLEEQLKGNEIEAFEKTYRRQIDLLQISDEKKQNRKKLIEEIKVSHTPTPFIYALCSFEDSFIKLSEYIKVHIGDVDELQKDILQFISIIHYYTGLEVPMILVKKIIDKNQALGNMDLKKVLSKEQYKLLFISDNGVRTLHNSVSGELIEQLCAKDMVNKKAWKNNLYKALELLIDMFVLFKDNEQIMRILKALFLNQQSSSKNDEQKHFSYAIEDLPTNVQKKEILLLLCEKFYKNPYVYSNLARYYHYIEEDEVKALDNLEKALKLLDDYTFHHLKGIILAKKMRNYIQKKTEEIKKDYVKFVSELNFTLEEIVKEYDRSLELNIENEAACTSKLNYILSTIREVNKNICPNLKVEQMIQSEKYFWCNDYIERAYETLDDMRKIDLYMNMDHEDIINNYECQLSALEGNLSKAISGWNSLLSKKDIYHPTIRRNLIKGYYRLCNQNWISLDLKKSTVVKQLLIDNIQAETENARNIVQWFDFARNFEDDLKKTVEYFSQYVSNPNLDYYYRAMLTFFAYGLEYNDRTYIKQGMEFSTKCEEKAREKPNRRLLLDVCNLNGKQLKKIERFDRYRMHGIDFNSALSTIPRIQGVIAEIDKPEIGWIIVDNLDIRIKFNPSYNSSRIYRKTKDEGIKVEFVLGFRLGGVFAFNVSDVI